MADERAHEPVPAEAPEKVAAARDFTEELLRRLGASVAVDARESPEAIALALTPRDGNRVELSSALVEAIQVLANRVANPTSASRKWVNLEVGGFGDAADPAMRAMAARLAESARRTGKTLAVAPISARERRLIHLALAEQADVTTRSEGEGLFRTLLVVPGAGSRR
jgi:spoIIIJ-associated protein